LKNKIYLLFSAKIDATANDYPGLYQVKGFPTIFFVPKNDKNNPKQYNVKILLVLFLINFISLGWS
jgi:hypothetical protein